MLGSNDLIRIRIRQKFVHADARFALFARGVQAETRSSHGAPRGLALLCAEIDRAADWTEKALDQRDPLMVMFLQLPLAKDLHASGRWPTLAKMMNLPIA